MLLIMVTVTLSGAKNEDEVSLTSKANSMIKSIENFKVIGLVTSTVVCIMPRRLKSTLIYRT